MKGTEISHGCEQFCCHCGLCTKKMVHYPLCVDCAEMTEEAERQIVAERREGAV